MLVTTGWSKRLCAPDDYNTIIRCTQMFWTPCTSYSYIIPAILALVCCVQQRQPAITKEHWKHSPCLWLLVYFMFSQHKTAVSNSSKFPAPKFQTAPRHRDITWKSWGPSSKPRNKKRPFFFTYFPFSRVLSSSQLALNCLRGRKMTLNVSVNRHLSFHA